jgi:hypothetical protein
MLVKLKNELNRYPGLEPIFELASSLSYLSERTPQDIKLGLPSVRFDSRFELAFNQDKRHLNELRRFLIYCDTVLMFVISRMEIKWYSGERPRRKEVEWYENIFGRENSNLFFLENLRTTRAKLYKGRICSSKKAKRNRDRFIGIFYEELFGEQEKFKNIKKRYPMFYNIVTDVVYPKFLRSEVELESPNIRASYQHQ